MLTLSNCGRVSDSTLACLHRRAPRLHTLTIADCPGVTANGLGRLNKLFVLMSLALKGVVTDAMLDSLHGCSQLEYLCLGGIQGPPEMTISVAAVLRLLVACGGLYQVNIHTTAASSQALIDALHQTDLGRDGCGDLRSICLGIPGPIYRQLTLRQPSHSRISVTDWPLPQ